MITPKGPKMEPTKKEKNGSCFFFVESNKQIKADKIQTIAYGFKKENALISRNNFQP
jgi:hypothetical protein